MEKKYFYGNEVSDYGMEHGKVDYRCLSKAFDAVLNNDIMSKTQEIGYWELENGSECYHEDVEGNVYYDDDWEDLRDELVEKLDRLNNAYDEIDEQYSETEDGSEEEKKFADQMKIVEEQISEVESEINHLEDEHYDEVYQWYIIDDNGADILKRETHEIVYYNEELDMYLWGVTHWGTSWDYVLTEIAC